jgi:PTS system nitrogen regulatory IIA component
MKITDYLDRGDIFQDLPGGTKEEVFARLIDALVANGRLPSVEPYLTALFRREELGTTAVGGGIAIPHARVEELDRLVMAFARFKQGIGLGALDNAPIHLIFLVLAPEDATEAYMRALARIASILRDPDTKKKLLEASSTDEIYELLREQDAEEE